MALASVVVGLWHSVALFSRRGDQLGVGHVRIDCNSMNSATGLSSAYLRSSLRSAFTPALVFCAASILPGAPPQAIGPQGINHLPAIVFVRAHKVVAGEWTRRFPAGSRLVLFDPRSSTRSVTELTPDFFAAADPQVSPDATKILFSAQRTAGALWQVWEMDANGSEQRQITHCTADCMKPAFLPHERIVYTAFSGTRREHRGIPGLPGMPRVATPEPAFTRSESAWP